MRACEFFHKLDEGLKIQLVTDMLLESSNTAFDKIKNDIVGLSKLNPKQKTYFYMATNHRFHLTNGIIDLDKSLLFCYVRSTNKE